MTALPTNDELDLPENATADERAARLLELGAYQGLGIDPSSLEIEDSEVEVDSDQWLLPFPLPQSQPIPHHRSGHLSRPDDQDREERAIRALQALRGPDEA